MTKTKNPGYDLVYLIGCSLLGTAPDPERVEAMDLERVFEVSREASLEAMACMTLESCSRGFSGPVAKRWQEDRNKVLRKTVLMDLERESLLQEMEQWGAWYVPLKGSILKDLYPRAGMRQMADTDILFDRTFRDRVCRWFQDRDYTVVSMGETNHDVYEKPPVLNFEMHVDLFSSYYSEKWPEYWESLEDRLLPAEGCKFGRVMTDEDFYLYLVAHSCKHYGDGGTGLRTLTDFWVWLREKEKTMDWERIRQVLAQLELGDYEIKMRTLCHSVFDAEFDPETLPEDQRQVLDYLLGSGTYGSWENEVTNAWKEARDGDGTERTGRLRYLWQRLFPGEAFYARELHGEEILKSPWKRFCYTWKRLWSALWHKKGQILRELKIIFARDK